MQQFPTFCHISEYGENGYAKLHQMVAVSHPLNLWAPSSQLLLHSPGCRVTPQQFVRYIEDGYIRILGRHDWLTEPGFRAKVAERQWAEAQWDPSIDGAILEILNSDPSGERVVVVGEEVGYRKAREHLDSDPALRSRWEMILNSKGVQRLIPTGTLQRVERVQTQDAKVEVVLRDAYNHGRAIAEAGALVPFLLEPADRKFLALLAGERSLAEREVHSAASARTRHPDDMLADVAEQLINFLAHLDNHTVRDHTFVGSEGHELLVAWFATICERIKDTNPSIVHGQVVAELTRQLNDAAFSRLDLRSLRRSFSSMLLGLSAFAGATSDLISVLQHPAEALGLISFAAGGIDISGGLLQRRGLIPANIDGPQWPFLYCYGRPATRRRLIELQQLLVDIDLAKQHGRERTDAKRNRR